MNDETVAVELTDEQLALVNELVDSNLGRHGREVDDKLLELLEELPDGGELARRKVSLS